MGAKDSPPGLWCRWLLAAGIWLALDAVSVILLPRAHARLFYTVLYDADAYAALTPPARDFAALLVATLAALEGATGVMVAFIAHGPFRRGERWAWWAAALSSLPWVIVAFAIIAIIMKGEHLSFLVIGSGYFAVLLWPPVIFTWRHFFQASG